MNNPWKVLLNSNEPYFLEDDKLAISDFNKRIKKEDYRIQDSVLPEPFIGNPNAPIVLLNLNPGYEPYDKKFFKIKYTKEVWEKNLVHASNRYPFYPLDPDIDQEWGGVKYWKSGFPEKRRGGRLKHLIELTSVEKVANSIFCIEWHPYHSIKYKSLSIPSRANDYRDFLLENALKRKASIICMRGKKIWSALLEKFSLNADFIQLNSPQNNVISSGNCSAESWNKIKRLLLK